MCYWLVLQLEAHENYGKTGDNGQPGGPARPAGRAPGSAAPRGINNVHSLFDNSTLLCHFYSLLLSSHIILLGNWWAHSWSTTNTKVPSRFDVLPLGALKLRISIKLLLCSCDHNAGSSGAAGDHGNVHVINSSRAWQTKVNEAKTARKVVSCNVIISAFGFAFDFSSCTRYLCLWPMLLEWIGSLWYSCWFLVLADCCWFYSILVWTLQNDGSRLCGVEQKVRTTSLCEGGCWRSPGTHFHPTNVDVSMNFLEVFSLNNCNLNSFLTALIVFSICNVQMSSTLDVQEVAAQYEVRAMPTFLFIKDGQQIDKVVGADKNDLERKCNRYATSLWGLRFSLWLKFQGPLSCMLTTWILDL